MTESISQAVAVRDEGPGTVLQQSRADLVLVMPSHLQDRVGAWIRTTQGLLRRDEKLMEAARNDVGQFMSVLLDAARLGLEPGTEQYYLVPRWNKKKRCTEVTGVRGYQGEIELMYRAGAVSSVVVDVVCEGDTFVWTPGSTDVESLQAGRPPRWEGPQRQPLHQANWLGTRGRLMGVYAYAIMKDGAVSRVTVLNADDIAATRAKSDSDGQAWSPWATDEKAMWLKTAAHRLAKWVPTSAEIRGDSARPAGDVTITVPTAPLPAPVAEEDEGPIDGELVEDGAP
jgi:recombination protein RecT